MALAAGCGGSASSSTLAYVSNSTGTGFTVFNVNNNGTLTTASISPQTTPTAPQVLQISPNGKWAYFVDSSTRQFIYGFTRSGNGTLTTAITGSPFPLTTAASSLVISPNSQFLYVALPLTKEIAIFLIDPSTGQLTELGSNQPVTSAIAQLAIAPDGLALYGLSPAGQSVLSFFLSPTSGAATPSNSPGAVGPTAPDNGMILSADGNFIYVLDTTETGTFTTNAPGITLTGDSPTIYGFSTKSNGLEGVLQPIPGRVFHENADLVSQAFPTVPVAGATSNDSRWLFIANQGSDNISVFDIHTLTGAAPQEVRGTVTTVEGVPVSTASPFNCCATPALVAVSKLNNAMYVLDTAAARIYQFAVDQNTGRLRPLNPASVNAGATPTWITIR
jgi:hypothetical protein